MNCGAETLPRYEERSAASSYLPEAFADDPDRLARFQREAQVLASLNHPGIAAIYGIEEAEGTRALVLELVEGPTLADRISKGPIPLDEALPIAKQIAEALEAAHEAGVIHRDLKPANIKVRDDGTVKVLDFGLAKALDTTAHGDPSLSPTLTAAATQMGVIMGTAAYMSPEQARGKPVDRRADIWAFGAVLFEMLTGAKPFPGDDISQTLARVIERDPDWEALPKTLPPALDTYLRRCLQRDPKERVRDIGDVRLAMEGAFDTMVTTPSESMASPTLRLWQRPVPLAAAMVGLVVLTGLGVWNAIGPASPPAGSVQRFALDIGPVDPIPVAGLHVMPALSPDGTELVYAARRGETQQLYLRALDSLEARPIPGTDNACEPFWSPDGGSLGFVVAGSFELKKVSPRGGQPRTLCECATAGGATWLQDGTIIFAGGVSSAGVPPYTLFRVRDQQGGTREQLTAPEDDSGFLSHLWPRVLPGESAILFTIIDPTQMTGSSIALLSLDTREWQILIGDGYNARYVASGHLLFGRQGALWSAPFDLDQLTVGGPEEIVLRDIETNEQYGGMALSLSDSGSLVYRPGDVLRVGSSFAGTPTWVDRSGNPMPIEALSDALHPRLSPDGTKLAVTVVSPEGFNVWVYDLERGTRVRLTDGGRSSAAAWSRDGERVFFGSRSPLSIVSRAADATGEPEILLTGNDSMYPDAWTPDGRTLSIVALTGPGANILTVSREGERSPYLERASVDLHPALSADGQWMAYASHETGQAQVYIQRFPELGEKEPISTDGGVEPRWSANGRELFYRNLAGDRMMMVTVNTEPTLRVSRPEVVFEGQYGQDELGLANYDVSANGQRFLMIDPSRDSDSSSETPPLVFVDNWFEELKRLVPVD